MLHAANVPCWVFSHNPRKCMSSIIRWRSGVVFSSFVETSCLTGGKAHIVSPERPHTKSNAELGTERQPQAPMPQSGLVPPPDALLI